MSRAWLIVPLLILYLLDLGGVGFLGPDEPRYASIGREMARSGDLITPRLDGQPWFEKPPLLYWMIAAGRLLHLPDEWAARLPMALASIGFLVFFFLTIARHFETQTAIAATTILATTAGWLAYSFGAWTDLPMSATFAAALLIALFDTRPRRGYIAGALLGLSILAKGLLPAALFLPILLVPHVKRLAILAGCLAVALPWYLLCWARNGNVFLTDFIWKHHVLRYLTPELQHVQPFWFFVPVLLALLFPWIPVAALLVSRKTYEDVRVRILAGWLIYALVFLSISKNKLPGYVLPLMPVLALVLAVALEKSEQSHWLLAASAALLCLLPVIARALPEAVVQGISKTQLEFAVGAPFLLVAAAVWWLKWSGKPSLSVLMLGMAVVFGMAYLKGAAFGTLDEVASARGFWRSNQSRLQNACIENVGRWEAGLNYYAGHPLPHCTPSEPAARPKITVRQGRLLMN